MKETSIKQTENKNLRGKCMDSKHNTIRKEAQESNDGEFVLWNIVYSRGQKEQKAQEKVPEGKSAFETQKEMRKRCMRKAWT